MQLHNETEQSCVPKKEKACSSAERNPNFYYKRRSAIKKLLELGKQYDQDIFICIVDKKNHKATQYSSDAENFNLNAVHKLIQKQKKKEIFQVQSLDNLDTCDSTSQNQVSEMGASDTTTATKKE
jgi:hypothetical protein